MENFTLEDATNLYGIDGWGAGYLLGVALIRELRSRGFFEVLAEPKIIDLLDLVALTSHTVRLIPSSATDPFGAM